MCGVFKNQGIVISKVYFCPFHPEHGVGHYKIESPFRKPAPGMIQQASQESDVDLAKSVLVGDKESGIQAGIMAGVDCNLLFDPSGLHEPVETAAYAFVNSLSEADQFLYPNEKC